jgi:hypothetical protein
MPRPIGQHPPRDGRGGHDRLCPRPCNARLIVNLAWRPPPPPLCLFCARARLTHPGALWFARPLCAVQRRPARDPGGEAGAWQRVLGPLRAKPGQQHLLRLLDPLHLPHHARVRCEAICDAAGRRGVAARQHTAPHSETLQPPACAPPSPPLLCGQGCLSAAPPSSSLSARDLADNMYAHTCAWMTLIAPHLLN